MFCVVIDLAEGERLSFQFFAWLHVITWSEGHYGWVSLFINDLSAKFGGHCPCRRGKILFLICHVSWCDHVVRGSCDIMGEFLSLSLHPANFGGHRRCAREKISFFVYHVTSRNFVVRESCDIMGEFPSSLVTAIQSLVIIDLFEEEILRFQSGTWIHVTTWLEGQVTSWVSSRHHKSPSC